MKDEATPEQIAMAVRIAEKVGRRIHVNDANRLYDMEQSALAAIIETTELAAKFAETIDPLDGPPMASLIRRGEHLKGHPHE